MPAPSDGTFSSLGCDHGAVVLDIPPAVADKERVTRMAYSHAQGRLHAIRPDSPGVREAAAAVLQKACEDRTLQAWLSSDQDAATMGTPEVQAVFDLHYAFRDDASTVTGVRMPSSVDPQYPYGQAETEASLAQVLLDQQALASVPMSCGNGTRRRPGSTTRLQLPCCGTSDRWTPTCPPPPGRTCTLLWTDSSTSSKLAWRSCGVSSGATGAGP